MSGILAMYGHCDPPLWERMLADLRVLGSRCGDWHADVGPVRLARARRAAHADATNEAAVVVGEDCAIVLDGRVPGADRVSESERVIASYRRWGDECIRHIPGEYAFALWDGPRRRFVAACDVVGSRSVSFHAGDGFLTVCSRATAILRDPRVPRLWNAAYIADVLADFWVQPPGATPFQGVRRIRPGFVLAFEDGRVTEREIDRLRPTADRKTPKERRDEFWSLLDRSCAEHLRSARRPCVALSGGLDSTTVAASLLDGGRTIDALTCTPGGVDERAERSAIAAFLERYPRVRWHAVACEGQPHTTDPLVDDPVAVAIAFEPCRLSLVKRAAAQEFTTLFDGEGGDELFALCDRVADLVIERAWRTLAARVWRHRGSRRFLFRELVFPLSRALSHLPPCRSELAAATRTPPWTTLEFARWDASRDAVSKLQSFLHESSFPARVQRVLHSGAAVGGCTRRRLLDAAYGVETVSPLLDRAIVEFAMGLPAAVRLGGPTKAFLRSAAAQRIPRAVADRAKSQVAYTTLLHQRLSNPALPSEVRTLLAREPLLGRLVDLGAVVRVLATFREGGPVDVWTGDRLLGLIELLRWMPRVATELGVRWSERDVNDAGCART